FRSPCSNIRPARPRQCFPRGGPPLQSPKASQLQRPRRPEQHPVSSKTNDLHIRSISDISPCQNDISSVISAQVRWNGGPEVRLGVAGGGVAGHSGCPFKRQ